jgi:ankyrin repeat protein
MLLSYGAAAAAHCDAFGTPLNSLCKGLRDTDLSEDHEESFSKILNLFLSDSSAEDLCNPDGQGRTPLHSLVDASKETVFCLDHSEQPPTLHPSNSNTVGFVGLLLTRLGSIDANIISHLVQARDVKGLLPLHIAASNGDSSLLKLLLLIYQKALDSRDTDGEHERENFSTPKTEQHLTLLQDSAGWNLRDRVAANGTM